MLLVAPGTALSQGGIEAGWADPPPALNGTIGAAEWASATELQLTPGEVNGEEAQGFGQQVSADDVTGWLYLMNDERYLYVAATLDIGAPAADPDYWLARFWVAFEDEPVIGDGRWTSDLCSQNPDEGVLGSFQEYSRRRDYDYFVGIAEEYPCSPIHWAPPG